MFHPRAAGESGTLPRQYHPPPGASATRYSPIAQIGMNSAEHVGGDVGAGFRVEVAPADEGAAEPVRGAQVAGPPPRLQVREAGLEFVTHLGQVRSVVRRVGQA